MFKVKIKNIDSVKGDFTEGKAYPVLHVLDADAGMGMRYIIPDDEGNFCIIGYTNLTYAK